MRVKTQLTIFVYASFALIAVTVAIVFLGDRQVESIRAQRDAAFALAQDVFQLQLLSSNYLFESGLVTEELEYKWRAQHNNTLQGIASVNEIDFSDRALINSMQTETISLRSVFTRLSELIAKESLSVVEQQLVELLRSQLTVKIQTVASESFQLDRLVRQELIETENYYTVLEFLMFLVFLITILSFSVTMRRYIRNILSIAQSIKEVARGGVTEIDTKLPIAADNEIGDLSRSFYSLQGAMAEHHAQLEEAIQEKTNELSKALKKEESQNRRMSHTQKAMINLLEDIAEERERFAAQLIETEKFKLAVEAVSEHIIITDPDGDVIFANQAVEVITGFSQEEILGTKAGKLWGGMMPASFYKKFWKQIKVDKKPFVGVITNKRKNGETYKAAVNVSPVVDDSGEVLFFVGIERDVTREQEVDQAKTEFVSLASHQLRTPLSAISWYAEMLLSGDVGKLSKEQREYLEEVYASNKRMSDLVNSLLNVSRIEMGTFIVEPENVDVAKLSERILKELTPKIKEKKHELVKKFSSRLSKKLKFDPRLLGIVIQNLLTNAIKYTPEKGKITFTLKAEKSSLIIKVADTGIGIPVYQKGKIFDKLFRADNVTTTDTDGNGLGLYLVKKIVELSKGSVSFTSTEGKGTTFTVKLPLKGMSPKKGTRRLT